MLRPTIKRAKAKLAEQRCRSLADELFDSWVSWREACEDVRSAYARWGKCKAAQRALAFASYRAALDREAHAASVHSVWTDRLRASTS